jgi:acetyl-CoA acetyltransferase
MAESAVWIVAACRTPQGRFMGALARESASALGVAAARAAKWETVRHESSTMATHRFLPSNTEAGSRSQVANPKQNLPVGRAFLVRSPELRSMII